MSEFKGYLIKFPKNGLQFPHKLIAKESYQATPLQRTEIKAYRDSNNLLRRVTSPNNKTKITFNTKDGLTLAEMRTIRSVLNGAMSNSQQRKLDVEYWDDELLAYQHGCGCGRRELQDCRETGNAGGDFHQNRLFKVTCRYLKPSGTTMRPEARLHPPRR